MAVGDLRGGGNHRLPYGRRNSRYLQASKTYTLHFTF